MYIYIYIYIYIHTCININILILINRMVAAKSLLPLRAGLLSGGALFGAAGCCKSLVRRRSCWRLALRWGKVEERTAYNTTSLFQTALRLHRSNIYAVAA